MNTVAHKGVAVTDDHEYHLHLLVCMDRLNAAWWTLKQIEVDSSQPLVGPAFRYALVEYATAFTRSDSPSKKRRFLPESMVPPTHLVLHQRIISARNSIHTHADLTILEAQLELYVVGGERQITRVENFIHGLEELTNLRDVVAMVEGVLRNLYVEHEKSKQRIAVGFS